MQSQAVLQWHRERDQVIRNEDCGARWYVNTTNISQRSLVGHSLKTPQLNPWLQRASQDCFQAVELSGWDWMGDGDSSRPSGALCLSHVCSLCHCFSSCLACSEHGTFQDTLFSLHLLLDRAQHNRAQIPAWYLLCCVPWVSHKGNISAMSTQDHILNTYPEIT